MQNNPCPLVDMSLGACPADRHVSWIALMRIACMQSRSHNWAFDTIVNILHFLECCAHGPLALDKMRLPLHSTQRMGVGVRDNTRVCPVFADRCANLLIYTLLIYTNKLHSTNALTGDFAGCRHSPTSPMPLLSPCSASNAAGDRCCHPNTPYDQTANLFAQMVFTPSHYTGSAILVTLALFGPSPTSTSLWCSH